MDRVGSLTVAVWADFTEEAEQLGDWLYRIPSLVTNWCSEAERALPPPQLLVSLFWSTGKVPSSLWSAFVLWISLSILSSGEVIFAVTDGSARIL